jgi:ribosomal protein L37AE/L43A
MFIKDEKGRKYLVCPNNCSLVLAAKYPTKHTNAIKKSVRFMVKPNFIYEHPYCPVCGSKLKEDFDTWKIIKCSNCGMAESNAWLYCPHCGQSRRK